MENAKKFFEELAKTEEAKALFLAIEAPETEEARIAAYIEIAKKLGIELTVEEINAYFESMDNSPLAEIDDEELAQLIGGGENSGCSSTYKHKENCWFNDGCDRSTNSYSDYLCYDNNYGKSYEDRVRSSIFARYFHGCDKPSVNQELAKYGIKNLY